MRFSIFFLFIAFVFSACFGDKPVDSKSSAITVDKMSGNWILLTATRDGDVTGTLDSTKFTITTQSMNSEFFSLLNVNADQPYALEVDNIKLPGLPEQKIMVKELTDSTLILETIIQGHPFELLLGRR